MDLSFAGGIMVDANEKIQYSRWISLVSGAGAVTVMSICHISLID